MTSWISVVRLSTLFQVAAWRSGNLRLHVTEVAPHWTQLVLGWVTVFSGNTTPVFSPSQPGQLSLLPSAEWEMSTGQRVVMLCDWGVREDGVFHMWINVSVAGKTV